MHRLCRILNYARLFFTLLVACLELSNCSQVICAQLNLANITRKILYVADSFARAQPTGD